MVERSVVALATEDELSEAVGIRLIREFLASHSVELTFRGGGVGYLRARLRQFCEISAQLPLILLADLDSGRCPGAMRAQWFPRHPQPPALVMRVCVREVESWILADHVSVSGFLGIPGARIPREPEMLADPKAALLRLASGAPSALRRELIAASGAIARQGLGYNSRLAQFVSGEWSPERAADRSESLRKAITRISELAG